MKDSNIWKVFPFPPALFHFGMSLLHANQFHSYKPCFVLQHLFKTHENYNMANLSGQNGILQPKEFLTRSTQAAI